VIETLGSLTRAAGLDIYEVRATEATSEEAALKALQGFGATDTGIVVNERNALAYMPVLACTRVISETLASMPCKLFAEDIDGSSVAKAHYLYSILHDEPNPEMSAFQFWEAVAVQLCLFNVAYAEIEWSKAGRVKALWPLLPDRTTPRRIRTQLVFDYIREDGTAVTLSSDDVLYIPGCLSTSGLETQSLIKYAREAIGLGLAPQKYASNFYKNNARPGMYLAFPGVLTRETRQQIAASWNDIHAGIQGAGRTGVVEGGGELKVPGVSQVDAEFSQTRADQLLEVCRVYRMPPHMIADLSHATYSNIEHSDMSFAKHTMLPYAKRCESQVNRKLVGVGTGYYCEFSMDALMRGDLLSRTEASARGVQSGLLTPNEGRALENRPRLKGGDSLMIQSATVPIELAGKIQPQQPAPDNKKKEDTKDNGNG